MPRSWARWIYVGLAAMLAVSAVLAFNGALFNDVWAAMQFSSVAHIGNPGFAVAFAIQALILLWAGWRPGGLAAGASILFGLAIGGFLVVGWGLVHVITQSHTAAISGVSRLPAIVLGGDAGLLFLGPIVHGIAFRGRERWETEDYADSTAA
jgi:hypothetical protein